MSLHNNPKYSTVALDAALQQHGLPDTRPSQLANAFRCGWVAAVVAADAQVNESWLLETFVKLADYLNIDLDNAKTQPGKPSDVFINAIERKISAPSAVSNSIEAQPSPTADMNIAQRILHVGGRNPPDSTYVEFGSIQAVEALVRQVLRDQILEIKPLEWTEARKANADCQYDHILGTCALGKFSIEWKSWKDYDSKCVYLNGEYLTSVCTIDEAKEIAFEYVQNMVNELTMTEKANGHI